VTDFSIFIMVMLLNGTPSGSPVQILTMTRDCRAETLVMEGINQAQADRGIQWTGTCLGARQTGDTESSSSR